MYKFEISAETAQELEEKMQEFADGRSKIDYSVKTEAVPEKPQYIDEVPETPDWTKVAKSNFPLTEKIIEQEVEKIIEQEVEKIKNASPFPEIVPDRVTRVDVGATLPVFQNMPKANFPAPEVAAHREAIQNVAETLKNPDKDADGMPWDARIHASTKAVTKDGTWRYMRGVDEDFVKQVEADTKSKLSGASVALAPVPLPPPPTIKVEVPVFAPPSPLPKLIEPVVVQAPKVDPNPPPLSYENVEIPVGTRPAHTLNTFKACIFSGKTPLIAQLINEGKITPAYVQTLNEYFGFKELWNVLGDEKKLYELYDGFCDAGFITRVEG